MDKPSQTAFQTLRVTPSPNRQCIVVDVETQSVRVAFAVAIDGVDQLVRDLQAARDEVTKQPEPSPLAAAASPPSPNGSGSADGAPALAALSEIAAALKRAGISAP